MVLKETRQHNSQYSYIDLFDTFRKTDQHVRPSVRMWSALQTSPSSAGVISVVFVTKFNKRNYILTSFLFRSASSCFSAKQAAVNCGAFCIGANR